MSATPKSRPRTKPPEERRDELMNSAQRLFLKQGVEPTTIEQITSAAGVAKGTFYLYFSSKDDIRLALGERFAEAHLTKIEAAVGGQRADDWNGKLSAWAYAGVGFYLEFMRLHDVLFYGPHSPTREGLVDNIIIDRLADMLRAGADAGAWWLDDPRFTAVFMFSGLHGVVDDAAIKEKHVDRKRLAERVKRICLRAVERD